MEKLNLHLFGLAETTTQTTLLNSLGNDLSPEMKTYYEKKLLYLMEPNLVYNQFGDEYPIPKNGGKTIEFRQYDKLGKAMTALTEGVTPTGQNMNVTTKTATVNQYGGWIRLSDMLELTAIDNNIAQANKMLASQAARTIDSLTRDIICNGSAVLHAPTLSGTTYTEVNERDHMDSTSVINRDMIERAFAELSAQDAPKINGSYVCIVHPFTAYDLRKCEGWLEVHKYAKPEEIFTGEIGELAGIRFVVSSEAKIIKDVTCPVIDSVSAFSSSSTYSVGDYCYHDDTVDDVTTRNVYKCTTAISTAGAWDADDWEVQAGDVKRIPVFCSLVLGDNAYGKTAIAGGGLEFIVKQKGSAGSDDPLNQRSTVGWKTTHVAERLIEQYMFRLEAVTSYKGAIKIN